MKIAPIDIAHKTFSKKMMGVDPEEAYSFLRDVADQMEELVRERNRLKEDLLKKDQSMAEYVERDAALRHTISAASKMSDQFRADAEKEAQLIINDARQRAEMMVQDARDSLKRMYHELADLKQTRMQFESGMRAMMQAHLTMLDQSRKVFPEPSLGRKIDFEESATPEVAETMHPANLTL
jgi:cell division initiation protein